MEADYNLQKYLSFVKTVEHGSFTKAAEMLNYSQSSISRMVADLEKEWGLTLLERKGTAIRPTSDGMKVLPYAERLVSEFQSLQDQVSQLNGLDSGLIRIGTFSSVAAQWIPNIITEFKKHYPNIEYELLIGDYPEIEQWVLEGRVDCGFNILPARNCDSIFLEKDEFVVVLPKSHPLAERETFPAEALDDYPFMLLGKGEESEIQSILDKYRLRPDVKLTTLDDYAIMSMVESGLGISVLPRLILKRNPYDIVVRSLDEPAYREIGLTFRNEKSLSFATKKFIEYLGYR